eukprot:930493-Prorocentrum_minimum.AAC.1
MDNLETLAASQEHVEVVVVVVMKAAGGAVPAVAHPHVQAGEELAAHDWRCQRNVLQQGVHLSAGGRPAESATCMVTMHRRGRRRGGTGGPSSGQVFIGVYRCLSVFIGCLSAVYRCLLLFIGCLSLFIGCLSAVYRLFFGC